jgi:hypothetical protein
MDVPQKDANVRQYGRYYIQIIDIALLETLSQNTTYLNMRATSKH